jgi:hypothetical protein
METVPESGDSEPETGKITIDAIFDGACPPHSKLKGPAGVPRSSTPRFFLLMAQPEDAMFSHARPKPPNALGGLQMIGILRSHCCTS